MKKFQTTHWKTDPRAAYIPGVALASFILILCVAVGPAWSFETLDQHQQDPVHKQELTSSSKSSSSTVVDPCLPLLKSINHISPASATDRNQRSAGKAAALGLVLGVRFALSPPTNSKSQVDGPRLDLWHTSGEVAGDRSALAVTAYRQCQKDQALKAIGDFRWAR